MKSLSSIWQSGLKFAISCKLVVWEFGTCVNLIKLFRKMFMALHNGKRSVLEAGDRSKIWVCELRLVYSRWWRALLVLEYGSILGECEEFSRDLLDLK
jgi:hypothetical protein